MKKLLAMATATCMVVSLAACGSSSSATTGSDGATAENGSVSVSEAAVEADAAGAITGIAQCCDVGTLDDESFNQGCWEAVEAYGEAKGIDYNYYLPDSEDASDEDRQTLVRRAVNDGANTVVCVGYLYGPALEWAATEYPDVNFIGVDMTAGDIDANGEIPDNVYCITFKEEQAGYLAGYAAVKDGFTKLGFLGGSAVPAVIRYGYGYVQGIDAAAQEMGVDVSVNYYYGGTFSANADVTAKMEGWYANGTQVVFACGGGIYASATEAADKYNGKVIGVDVDQNYIGVQGVENGQYQANPFLTSAMKGLGSAVTDALDTINSGEWSTIAGTNGNYGLQEGDYIGLPTDEASWNFSTFTVDEYNALVEKIRSGEITIDNSSDDTVKPTTSSYVTVDYQV